MNTKDSIKQIGYMPSTLEDEKITLISEVFELTRVSVIRNLMYSTVTLGELYKRAKELQELRGDDNAINIADNIVGDRFLFNYPNREGN